MKSKIICSIAITHILLMASIFAQLPLTVDEVKKILPISNLEKIAESEGIKGRPLDVEAIRRILTRHENALVVGDMSDASKFATIRDLCSRIEALPDRAQLGEDLFKLFKKLDVMEGEPKDWNEILIKGEEGSLGPITKCLLASSGEEMRSKILDYLLAEDQLEKAKLFLKKATFAGEGEEMKKLVGAKMKAAKSDEMKEILLHFTEQNPDE
ncbi:MAG: hypothetical protein EOP06_07035 [Proteobacteria bacterium]|nr:MAG: hypothetical protein EOP06_07035 [Pseudomonadota bacterium]